eukprot:TRINITY_DN55651_c0_g1_i1.p1 TRINITY_DN55651_c0_g1~~TRINITY_DN55651_c0_g1_i1.p1  ORF type:complete len:184 (-),score=20.55 TRINITY_DN55651_c0_g1_i1:28-579(-)
MPDSIEHQPSPPGLRQVPHCLCAHLPLGGACVEVAWFEQLKETGKPMYKSCIGACSQGHPCMIHLELVCLILPWLWRPVRHTTWTPYLQQAHRVRLGAPFDSGRGRVGSIGFAEYRVGWVVDQWKTRQLDQTPNEPRTGPESVSLRHSLHPEVPCCLLYTSDAADEEDSVDLGGSRIIKKKKK